MADNFNFNKAFLKRASLLKLSKSNVNRAVYAAIFDFFSANNSVGPRKLSRKAAAKWTRFNINIIHVLLFKDLFLVDHLAGLATWFSSKSVGSFSALWSECHQPYKL